MDWEEELALEMVGWTLHVYGCSLLGQPHFGQSMRGITTSSEGATIAHSTLGHYDYCI